MANPDNLETRLSEHAREGELFEKLPEGNVRCFACAHGCRIPEGKAGVCRIRFNRNGVLQVPSDYVAGLQADPIEKKPFYHALPGAKALSFGMLGCDLHCPFCQNWITSQVFQDPRASVTREAIAPISAEQIVRIAVRQGARVVTSTYNEPLITSEWAVEIFKLAKREGLITSFVSNGHGTPEVIEYLRPWVDLFKVDLKSFDEKSYRVLGGKLSAVLETIRALHAKGFWIEVVTLIVPGFNDSDDELKSIAGFLTSVSPAVPWHVTAFHGDYQMEEGRNTDVNTLVRAAEIGKKAGLKFVYAGNLPGRVSGLENTYCPDCRGLLIERIGFTVTKNRLVGGHCPECNAVIPGVWA